MIRRTLNIKRRPRSAGERGVRISRAAPPLSQTKTNVSHTVSQTLNVGRPPFLAPTAPARAITDRTQEGKEKYGAVCGVTSPRSSLPPDNLLTCAGYYP